MIKKRCLSVVRSVLFRREQVARMVAKSRQAEQSSSSESLVSSLSLDRILPNSGPVSASAILMAGAVAVTGLLAYYLFKK